MHFGRVLIFSETRLVIARGFRTFGQLQDKVSNTYLVKYPPNQYTDRFSKFSFNREDVRSTLLYGYYKSGLQNLNVQVNFFHSRNMPTSKINSLITVLIYQVQ